MAGIFRNLRADEVECRVAMIDKKHGDNPQWMTLLLYKDARCDMNILDETVGPYNWKREHSRDNANCTVSLWDDEKGEWVSKEDTGTESNTEAKKGLASDSFKRACFNWGIGRELYTAPTIFIKLSDNGNRKNDRYEVSVLKTEDAAIVMLAIVNTRTGAEAFRADIRGDKPRDAREDAEPRLETAKNRLWAACKAAAARSMQTVDDYMRGIYARPDWNANDADALERIAEEVEQS